MHHQQRRILLLSLMPRYLNGHLPMANSLLSIITLTAVVDLPTHLILRNPLHAVTTTRRTLRRKICVTSDYALTW